MSTIDEISGAVARYGWSVGRDGPWYYARHPRITERSTGRVLTIRRMRPESIAEEIRIESRRILDPRAARQVAAALDLDYSPTLA